MTGILRDKLVVDTSAKGVSADADRHSSRSLVAFAYAASMVGFLPGISLYGQELKMQLQLTQKEVLQLAGVQNLLGFFGAFFGGIAKKLGARASILCGGFLAAAAQAGQYVIAVQLVQIPAAATLPSLIMLQVVARCGLIIADATAFTVPVKIFRKQRSMVSAVMTGFVPGSLATCAQVAHLLAVGAGLKLAGLLFWPIWTVVVSIGVALSVPSEDLLNEDIVNELYNLPTTPAAAPVKTLLRSRESLIDAEGGHSDNVNVMFVLLLVFGFLSILQSMLPPLAELPRLICQVTVVASFLFPTCFCCCGDLLSCIRAWLARFSLPLLTIEAPKQCTCAEMLQTMNSWLWLLTVAFVYSGSQVFSSSAGQITIAAGMEAGFTNSVVSTWSGAMVVGSLSSPFLSDVVIDKGCPRTLLGFVSSLLVGSGHALLAGAAGASVPGPLLLGGAFCIGFGMGNMTVQAGVVVCELFGKTHLISNYAFYSGVCHGPVPYALMLIAGKIYDGHTAGAGHTCIGPDCFYLAHFILALGNSLGALAALILSVRTSHVYCSTTPQTPSFRNRHSSWASLPNSGWE